MGKILSINISSERGTSKESVPSAEVMYGWGIVGDAHGGDWDRQISIFPIEAMSKIPKEKFEEVSSGAYTENITISGIPFEDLSIGKIINIGECKMIITHVGKDVYKENGRPYIVSREGRFCKVIKGGIIKSGDEITVMS